MPTTVSDAVANPMGQGTGILAVYNSTLSLSYRVPYGNEGY